MSGWPVLNILMVGALSIIVLRDGTPVWAEGPVRRLPPVTQPTGPPPGTAPMTFAPEQARPLLPAARPFASSNVLPAAAWQQSPVVQPQAEVVPPGLVVDQPSALLLPDVVNAVINTFPTLEAAYQSRNTAQGKYLSTLGAFDTTLEAGAYEQVLGFYRNYRHEVGLKQKTWQGTEFYGGYRIGRGKFEPWYGERATNDAGEFKAGLAIPLLRGRDIDKSRADAIKAQLARRAIEPAIQAEFIGVVRSSSIVYWEWVAAGEGVRIAQSLLKLAQDRDQAIRTRVARGELADVEIVDNERLIVSRQAKLIQAERKLQQTAIKLSLFLRTPDGVPQVPDAQLLPRGFPAPDWPHPTELNTDIGTALMLRPEPQELLLLIRQTEVDLNNARNQMLPGLAAGMEGAKNVGPEASSLGEKGPFQLRASLVADVPLQRRDARGQILAAQGKLAELRAKRRLVEDKIVADVRDAVSALTTAREQVVQAGESRRLAEAMQAAERRKFESGVSDLLVVNLREQATADAAQTEVEALLIYFAAVADYQAALGQPRPGDMVSLHAANQSSAAPEMVPAPLTDEAPIPAN